MINRRHIRVKVMQSVYAMIHAKSDNLIKEEKFLRMSIDKMYDLYVLSLDMLVRVNQHAENNLEASKKKYFATKEDLNPNKKFINNKVIALLKESVSLQNYIEDHKLNNWYLDSSYVGNLYKALMTSDLYKDYMAEEENTFKKDQKFVIKFFEEFVAPNEKLAEYYEGENISWVDDIPFVNTWIVRTLQDLKSQKPFVLGKLYKNSDDEEFASHLFRKVVLNLAMFEKEIEDKTPNWETDRIADVDMILIKMAICEFLKFPSIPVKASINEYLEIAKDYSTDKSSVFINGVLDKIWKDFEERKILNKIGRGTL
ncbi:transcription antitermination factor NusB [Wenyingzhuangia sp. 2_MG-2023]|uniref:transcription antitermination factor NusB n=1 Tax=Wenyingzhuangia sp. 2_MG-2023 TaxID=3062639 RepID=UPI0026E21701|nr:transcription antitermination factor NusB [Wenyingzhuangia sp. 2_MG-2023]MDO6739140.1 transcription antitermination factor NusB [Wenyingzhuangia sp. 2_MG-2023]MDO6803629.1 transcription antitermination factor NusB [Wenyingzhuangia sp. 1_MG-2023]